MTHPADGLVAPWVQSLKAYPVEHVDGVIKLDAMENPYPFPDELLDAWTERIQHSALNRYPDPTAGALKSAMRKNLDLPDSAPIVIGNGSDEIIHMLYLAYNKPGAKVLSPAPSFAVYPLAAQALGIEFIGVPLERENFSLDLSAFRAAITKHNPALIFLASPNNPTGNRFSDNDIKAICEASTGLVVLDEAYWRFAGSHRIKDLAGIQNLVFMHTLSKIGLAGIRLGALVGAQEWLEPLERVRMPYNVGTLTQITGCFALENDEVFSAQVTNICRSRKLLYQAMQEQEGIEVWPSESNFLLFRIRPNAKLTADQIHQALRDEGVLIKNLNSAHPFLKNCLRVSVGTDRENTTFLQKLQRALS